MQVDVPARCKIWFMHYLWDGCLLLFKAFLGNFFVAEIYSPDGALVGTWKAFSHAPYWRKSAILISPDGVEELVFFDKEGIVALDPRTGTLLGHLSYGSPLGRPSFFPVTNDLVLVRDDERAVHCAYSRASSRLVAEWKHTKRLGDGRFAVLPNGLIRSYGLECREGPVEDYDLFTGKLLRAWHAPRRCGPRGAGWCGYGVSCNSGSRAYATDASTGIVYWADTFTYKSTVTLYAQF